MKRALFSTALFVSLTLSGTAYAASYSITDLGSYDSSSAAINDSGQVALSSSTGGHLWSNGSVTDLGLNTQAYGINNSGQMVGAAPAPSGYDSHAILWSNGVGADLGTLGGSGSVAMGINDSGQVVGWARANGEIGQGGHAFIYSQDAQGVWGMSNVIGVPLSTNSLAYAINNSGQIAGAVTGYGTSEAFVASNGSVTYLGTFGGNQSSAFDINSSGQVVGMATSAGGYGHAFLYSNGYMLNLVNTPNMTSYAWGINDSGQVVGEMGTSAFLYSNGSLQDLNILADASAAGWQLYSALDINNNGQIVGEGKLNGIVHAFLLTPVPEPESYAMMLAGLGLVGLRIRQRQGRRELLN